MAAATWTMAYVLLVASAGPADNTYYIKYRSFQIPIGFKDTRRGDMKEVILYLAGPDGKSWNPISRTSPDKEGFPFRAEADGGYVFKLAVVNSKTHKQEPEDVARDGEAKRIVVDTVKPVLRLLSAERQGDEVLVRWTLDEANPDWTTFKLEYLAAEGGLPARVTVANPESGQASFHVTGSAVAVRVSLTDLAKNESDPAELPIKNSAGGTLGGAAVAADGPGPSTGALPPLTGEGAPPAPLPQHVADGWSPTAGVGPPPVGQTKGAEGSDSGSAAGPNKPPVVAVGGSSAPPAPGAGRPRGTLPPVQMVRKRQITIDYAVTKFGPSGIRSVDLYVTRDDGRTWDRCQNGDTSAGPPTPDERGGSAALKRSLTVELKADGLYGFFLVVTSGAGLGGRPPQDGIDPPQMRVEVDTTAPQADLYDPIPHPTRRDCLVLRWMAKDNKLAAAPITLQWAERPDGDWQTIGGEPLPNTGEFVGQVAGKEVTGSHVWQVPTTMPPNVYLRMLVRDLAGNESVAQTAKPVLVDLNEPEIKPLQISVNPH